MSERAFCAFFILLISSCVFGQDKISGTILSVDENGPIQNAHISIYSLSEKSILAFTFSDEKGNFTIPLGKENVKSGILLEASFLGFQKFSITYYAVPSEKLIIRLRNSPFEINDVVVKAPKVSMRGDTLNYLTSGFVKEQDRNIGEVLKRIPGIFVDESGLIKYNNKPINALYIDGKNMLEGQYSLATKNIRPDLVTLIQVFENHQPVKVLKEHLFSENAGINLKIAPEAKSRFIGSTDLGVGLNPVLWDTRLTFFRFAKVNQTLAIFKSNNYGTDISADLLVHNLGSDNLLQQPDLTEQKFLNITGKGSTPLSSARTRFNTSHLASVNLLLPMTKSLQATFRVSYVYEKDNFDNQQLTRFIINGEEGILLSENNKISSKEKVPMFDFTISSNTDKIYFKNRLYGKLFFSDAIGVITGNYFSNQKLLQNRYDAAEILSIIKPVGKIILKFNSRTQLTSLPEALTVVSDSIKQNVNLFQVKSNNIVSTQINHGWFCPEVSLGYNQLSQKLITDIVDMRNSPQISGNNDINFSNSELFFTSTFRYEKDNIRMQLRLPVKYYFIDLDDRKGDSDTSLRIIRGAPFFMANVKFLRNMEGSIAYSYGAVNQSDVQNMASSYILNNYRTLSQGYLGIIETQNHLVSLNIIYRNVLKLFTAGCNAGLSFRNGGVKRSLEYINFLTVRKMLPEKYLNNKTYYITGNLSKAYFDNPLILKAQVSYSQSNSDFVQQDRNIHVTSESWLLEPSLSYSFGTKINSELNLTAGVTQYLDSKGYNSTILGGNTTLLTYMKLTEKVDLSLNIDYYLEKSANHKMNDAIFADLRFNYKIGKSNIGLDLRNIFNKTHYIHTIFSESTRVEKSYSIRPRNLMITFTTSF